MPQSDLTYDVIGAAMEVHRELGSGLRESPYENALRNELRMRGYQVDQLSASEEAQLLNYLKISKLRLGLLLNFKPASLEVKRMAL